MQGESFVCGEDEQSIENQIGVIEDRMEVDHKDLHMGKYFSNLRLEVYQIHISMNFFAPKGMGTRVSRRRAQIALMICQFLLSAMSFCCGVWGQDF